MPPRRIPSGKWEVRWRDGARRRSKSFTRKADAERFERDRRIEAELGAFGSAAPSSMRLSDWLLDGWLPRSRDAWTRNTAITHAAVADRWILPYVGSVALRDLGTARIREWRNEVMRDGATRDRANKATATLSACLGSAVEAGLIPHNPVRDLKRLPVQRKPINALSVDEIERIRSGAKSARDRLMVSLLAYGGLRPQEALGLRWEDVDGGQLRIGRVFTAGEVRDSTKTHQMRSVPILAPLGEDLGAIPQGLRQGFVVTGRHGHPIELRNWRRRNWQPMVDAAGVDATPYGLRHSCASGLIYEGRALPEVAAIMGHGLDLLMRTYAHQIQGAGQRERDSYEMAAMAARRASDGRSADDSGKVVPLTRPADTAY